MDVCVRMAGRMGLHTLQQVDNTFEIHTHDQFGNAVGIGGESFDAILWGPERTVASILDRQDSTYLVTYRVNTPGEYQLRVLKDEVDLPGSPFACYIDPLPNEMYAQLYGQVQARTVADGVSDALAQETELAESHGGDAMAAMRRKNEDALEAPLFWKLELTVRQGRNLAVEQAGVGNDNMTGTLFVMGEPMVILSHSGASVQVTKCISERHASPSAMHRRAPCIVNCNNHRFRFAGVEGFLSLLKIVVCGRRSLR